jgi:flagellar basal body rod protein FlgC
LEGPAVDAVAEMIDVLSAERSFESAEKAVAAIDATRQKSADAARVK